MPHESEFVRLTVAARAGDRLPALRAHTNNGRQPFIRKGRSMRYLRLIPLLVLAFGAPASADDHRVNFNGMLSLASGSSLFGAHGSESTAGVGPPKFTVVLSDNSSTALTRRGHDDRVANMSAPDWTQPVVRAHGTRDSATVAPRFRRHQHRRDSKREFAFAPGGWRMVTFPRHRPPRLGCRRLQRAWSTTHHDRRERASSACAE